MSHDEDHDHLHCDHDHDGASSSGSTEHFDHEPFETFKSKVNHLFEELYPNNPPVAVERMEGGSFNRIVGVALEDDKRCVLRVPRFSETVLDHEAAIISYLHKKTEISVPLLLKLDKAVDNPIESPYMIQSRLPGQTFYHGYDELDFQERKIIVMEMVKIIIQMDAVTFGHIGLLREDASAPDGVRVGSFDEADSDDLPDVVDPPTNTVRSFLETRFKYMKEEEVRLEPDEPYVATYMDAFLVATEKLASTVSREKVILHHVDFFPRNILLHKTDKGPIISGIIDWDQTAAAPIQMAYELPSWLWSVHTAEEVDYSTPEYSQVSDEEPADEQNLALKQLFETEIVKSIPDFLDVVRSSWRLKELIEFAAYGLATEEDVRNANTFLELVGIPVPTI